MRASSIDEYLKLAVVDGQENHELNSAEFPYVVVVEGDYPEFDVAARWCWTCFGPQHGDCWSPSEYAVCPVVLKTEHSTVRSTPDGKIYEIKTSPG
jgi:hypothetical protein